jgi:hypothetical protein
MSQKEGIYNTIIKILPHMCVKFGKLKKKLLALETDFGTD